MENSKEGNILRPDFLRDTESSEKEEDFAIGQAEDIKEIVVTNKEGTKVFNLEDLNKRQKNQEVSAKILPFRKKQLAGV